MKQPRNRVITALIDQKTHKDLDDLSQRTLRTKSQLIYLCLRSHIKDLAETLQKNPAKLQELLEEDARYPEIQESAGVLAEKPTPPKKKPKK